MSRDCGLSTLGRNRSGRSTMIRLLVTIAIAGAVFAVPATFGAARSAGKAPTKATVVIRHQLRGCHSWSVNGNASRPAQSARLGRGGTMTFIDNDVMAHKLIQKSG